jgi:outer membrane protein, multidrug efflux system
MLTHPLAHWRSNAIQTTPPTPGRLAPRWVQKTAQKAGGLVVLALLAACSVLPPGPLPDISDTAGVPGRWQHRLPHDGQLSQLRSWWAQWNDPWLLTLQDAAQQLSPTLALASANLAQARAQQIIAGAALWPALDASASLGRGVTQPGTPLATVGQAGVQARWELDLSGAQRLLRDSATARLEASQAQWHVARVSVAADTARHALMLRQCLEQQALVQREVQSRETTEHLLRASVAAGTIATQTLALGRVNSAETRAQAVRQQALCDTIAQALATLTGLSTEIITKKSAPALSDKAFEATFSIASIPTELLMQRPDIWAASRDMAAAALDAGTTEAQRYPSLSLVGSIGTLSAQSGAGTTNLTTWSIGPLELRVPVWDAGRQQAQVNAAHARYQAASQVFRATARAAVGEVEDALNQLHSTGQRLAEAQIVTEGLTVHLQSTLLRQRAGLASQLEVEEATLLTLGAQKALSALKLERQLSWIQLYRAAGGGWSAADDGAKAASPT